MMINLFNKFFIQNGLVIAFFMTAMIMLLSKGLSENLTKKKIPASAIAIFIGLLLAFLGGWIEKGKKGIADIPEFSGFGILGGAMFRDFAVVSTAMNANLKEIKKAGLAGLISLLVGVLVPFILGSLLAVFWGYTDPISITTIGAGACTFIVGPITGGALGADSAVIALSIAAGLVKAILVTITTAPLAKSMGLDNPQTAMVYGGLMGTTSGVVAGLAATDQKLVPYGAMTATFYSGLGCLLCPSLLYFTVRYFCALYF